MTNSQHPFTAKLFYSYCHKDERYRDSMESSLALLKREGLLKDWSDKKILPGEAIPEKVREKMEEADITVFLLSKEFINSDECMKEWDYAKQLRDQGKSLWPIPIILKDCAWKDLLGNNPIKVLPKDGKPIARYDDDNVAWNEIYEGIKDVISQMRKNFEPRQEFLREMEETGLVSQDKGIIYLNLQITVSVSSESAAI